MAWTEFQEEAIQSRNQNLLLSAAAGSGKTAVLVERIIRRLLDKKEPLDITEILVVTFTKAAAGEMRDRIGAALTAALAERDDSHAERQLALLPSAKISTFHAFCQYVIRTYFYTIDLDPQFTVAGTEELELLKQSVMEDLFLSYYEDSEKAKKLALLADIFGSDRGDDGLMELVGRIYEYIRSQPWPLEWLHHAVLQYEEGSACASIDELPWTAPIMSVAAAALNSCSVAYDEMLRVLDREPELQSQRPFFAAERQMVEAAAACRTWTDLAAKLSALNFERIKALRNLTPHVKELWEECKERRNGVKAAVGKLQGTYFAVPAERWLDGIRKSLPVMHCLAELTADFYEAYKTAKKEKNWLDFGDLEHFCLAVLTEPRTNGEEAVPSKAAFELQQAYKEILIDEYQDTNGVQELITNLISNGHNKFMVGDIKQSIYRFRLADPSLFMKKYVAYGRDAAAADRCIDLSRNFRSTPAVINAVNEVFAYAMTEAAGGMTYGEREKLYIGRSDGAPGRVELHLLERGTASVVADDEEQEDADDFARQCICISRRISELIESGATYVEPNGEEKLLQYRHMAVLLRSTARKSDILLATLQAAGIPAYAEQKGGYFDVMEVRLITSLLMCIDNPCQDIPLAAVLRSPMVGLDETALAELRLSGEGYLWDCVSAYVRSGVTGRRRDILTRFCKQMDEWRTFSRRAGVAELLKRLYDDTLYFDYVGGMRNGALRQANLEALYERARQYEGAGFHGLFRFLKFIEKMKQNGVDLAPPAILGEGENVVRIMTIHKSKGLEFPVVFLADTEKGFNKKDTQEAVLFHKDLGIGIKEYDAKWRMTWPTLVWNGIKERTLQENKAEEERLLYVAMTRAKNLLVIVGTPKGRAGSQAESLAQNLQQWCGEQHPEAGESYLDWIMPVVMAAPGSEALQGTAATAEAVFHSCGIWHVALRSITAGELQPETGGDSDDRLHCVRENRLTLTTAPAWLEENLSWQYPCGAATVMTAKLSVTEIKRRIQEENRDEESAALIRLQTEEEDVFQAGPSWLEAERQEKGGAFAGTAFHKVMQHLELSRPVTADLLKEQCCLWVEQGILTAEENKILSTAAVSAFTASPLARRIAASIEVHREYPFTLLLDSSRIYADVKGEEILIQGVIDCLFKEENTWVIVDYKTDRLPEEADFRARYGVQLSLYRRAVEQMSGEEVREVIIYSSYLQKEIIM